jgi:prepilin-type N-terminal cleavage/methylation domain-containing protein/prepilin-type processing-associated H-X9-DG protein
MPLSTLKSRVRPGFLKHFSFVVVKNYKRRLEGFSLIELLVVISIIALLSTLVIAAINKTKSAAMRTRCIANLRQLGIATTLYWDDNNGCAFRYRSGSTNDGDIYWFGWLQRGLEGQREFDPSQGALYRYISGKGITTCPALPYTMAKFKLKARGASFGYGYSLVFSAPISAPPVKVSSFKNISRLALFADSAQINTFQPPASPENPMLEEFYYITTNEPTVHFRHLGKAIVAFGDSHVESVPPYPGSLDFRLPDQIIGALAPDKFIEN